MGFEQRHGQESAGISVEAEDLETAGSVDERKVEELVNSNIGVIDRWARKYARPDKQLDASELGGIGRLKAVTVARQYLAREVEGQFSTYLHRALINNLNDMLRRRGLDTVSFEDPMGEDGLKVSDQLAAPDTSDPETLVMRDEQIEMVRESIKTLSPEHRDAITLAMQDYTYEEMATMLGIPIGTLRSRLSRGYKKLRTALEAHPFLREE